MLNKLNILKFIGNNLGGTLSIIFVLIVTVSIGLNIFLLGFKSPQEGEYNDLITKYEKLEDSMEIYRAITKDSIKKIEKENKLLNDIRNGNDILIEEQNNKIKTLESKIDIIKQLPKVDTNLTNEEMDIILTNKFGVSK